METERTETERTKPAPMSAGPLPPTGRYWGGLVGLFILLMLGAHHGGPLVWPGEALAWRWLGIGVIVASVTAAVALALALRALQRRPAAFVQGVLGGTMLRLVVGIVGVVGVALGARAGLVPFVVGFFAGYFVLTGFEVWALLHILRRLSKTPGQPSV